MSNISRNIAVIGKSELETRVIKACFDDDDKPKEKHVAALIEMSGLLDVTEFVPALVSRLAALSWREVLKNQVVIHRILREGDEKVIKRLSEMPKLLDVGHFLDAKDQEALGQSKFIRIYGQLLQEFCGTYKEVSFFPGRKDLKDIKEHVMGLPINTLLNQLPRLQSGFDKLIATKPFSSSDYFIHPIASSCYLLLYKDAFKWYTALSLSMVSIVEKYQKVNLRQAQLCLKAYKQFIAQIEIFKKWSAAVVKLEIIGKDVLPDFNSTPSSVVELLETHIQSLAKNSSRMGDPEAASPQQAKAAAQPKAKAANTGADEEEDGDEDGDDGDEEDGDEEDEDEKKQAKPAAAAAAKPVGARQGAQPMANAIPVAADAKQKKSANAPQVLDIFQSMGLGNEAFVQQTPAPAFQSRVEPVQRSPVAVEQPAVEQPLANDPFADLFVPAAKPQPVVAQPRSSQQAEPNGFFDNFPAPVVQKPQQAQQPQASNLYPAYQPQAQAQVQSPQSFALGVASPSGKPRVKASGAASPVQPQAQQQPQAPSQAQPSNDPFAGLL